MSNREKAAWVSLLLTGGIWGYYFVRLWMALGAGRAGVGEFIGLFVSCVVISVVAQIAISIAFAVAGQDLDAPADERDRAIELKATRSAYGLLSFGALMVSLATPFVVSFAARIFDGDPAAGTALVIGNGVLAAVLLAEAVKSLTQILLYRWGGAD